MRIIPALTKPSGMIFREDFVSPKLVVDNNGVIAGTPTISNGVTITNTNSQGVAYSGTTQLCNNAIKQTLRLKWKQIGANDGNNILTKIDASSITFRAYTTGGNFVIFVGAAYAAFSVAANTTYDLFVVYDGSQGTANNRIKIWNVATGTPVSVTLTYSGTLPTSLPISSGRILVGGLDPTPTWACVTGTIFYLMHIFNSALDTNEMTDIIKETIYNEIQPSNFQVWSNFNTNYVNDAGVRATDNIGSLGGVLTLGDGSTSGTLPASISPRGFDFASSGRYLQLAHATIGNPTNTLTAFVITRINTSVINTGLILKYGASNGYGLLGTVTAGVMTVQYYFSGANNFTGTKKINDGLYHTIIVTYDGTTAKGYVDGVLDGSGTFSASFTSTNPLYINGDAVYTGRYNTKMYGAGVSHNVAATPTQVKYLDAMLRASLNI